MLQSYFPYQPKSTTVVHADEQAQLVSQLAKWHEQSEAGGGEGTDVAGARVPSANLKSFPASQLVYLYDGVVFLPSCVVEYQAAKFSTGYVSVSRCRLIKLCGHARACVCTSMTLCDVPRVRVLCCDSVPRSDGEGVCLHRATQ